LIQGILTNVCCAGDLQAQIDAEAEVRRWRQFFLPSRRLTAKHGGSTPSAAEVRDTQENATVIHELGRGGFLFLSALHGSTMVALVKQSGGSGQDFM
jgi:hypothetical protein